MEMNAQVTKLQAAAERAFAFKARQKKPALSVHYEDESQSNHSRNNNC